GALTFLCQRLKVTAGVKGVALARGRAGEALEVLAAAGSCPSLAPVGEHLACLAWAGNLTAGQAQVLEVEQMHGAVVSAPAGGWLTLVATGDGDGDVAPVLKVLIGLLARKLLTFKGEDIPEGPHPVDELIFPEGHVVLTSKAMEEVYARIRQVARSDFPVLFQGETGVGKEHMVTILHLSSRRSGALVAVNCAAIPGDLLEAELFGIEKGVATGVWAREGKFQQAHGGTLFLDEVGEMPPALQPKLLRVLQAGEVVPVGAKKPVRVDVRVVAATNCCLAEKVEQGSFRGDLYYRLAGMVIEVPPLRQLPEDIPSLVSHFLHREAKRLGKPVRGMSERALEALVAYHWPGNIRQLEYEVRRLVTACPAGGLVTSEMLSPEVRKPSKGQEEAAGTLALPQRVAALERQLIAEALRRTGGNLAAAARLLGISRYGLVLKAKRLGILADARKANQL
ncbi:MAG: sigma 54-interacting transcriptional regulator, partial [Thermoanaerobaculum sp.]